MIDLHFSSVTVLSHPHVQNLCGYDSTAKVYRIAVCNYILPFRQPGILRCSKVSPIYTCGP